MKTLQEEWRDYRDAAYPKGTHAQQNIECHQAFMAGALVYCQAIDAMAGLSDKEAMIAISKLKNEVWEINMHRAHMKARN